MTKKYVMKWIRVKKSENGNEKIQERKKLLTEIG